MRKAELIIICLVLALSGFILPKTGLKAGLLDFLYTNKDILSVSGNKILLNKQTVWLSGVAVGDPHSRAKIDRRTVDDYRLIKSDWQANAVRLSVHPGVFKKDADEMKKIMKKEVAAARAQGLYVIIDWHVIGMPNGWYKPCAYGEDHYYNYDSNFNTAKEFWEMMAVEYRGDRGVMFEIWNEPADPDTNEWASLRPYMERLYAIIRSQGANNIIIAPGVWWTYDLRGVADSPLKGENIAYAWHNYPSNTRYLSWDQALDGLNEKYPVIMTEWGYETDTASSYYTKTNYAADLQQYIYNKGLHFTAWCWHGSWKPSLLQSDWREASAYGKFIKAFLAEFKINKQFGQSSFNNPMENFIINGMDANSRKMGEGERAAVVYSFKQAFGRLPASQADLDDVYKIANGLCPKQKSLEMEKWAMAEFNKIYLRPARLADSHDYMAVMIMSYGLRQKSANRNLLSEAQGIKTFKAIYHKLPQTTQEWNIMQAITYSGAKR